MFRKAAVITLGGSTALAVGILSQNRWDINSIGAVRFGRAAVTFASIAADYKLSIYGRKLPSKEEEINKLWSEVHTRSAQKLLRLCESNRGVFIKVGQHLGALEYILPQEYCKTLKVLHNAAPQSSIEDVYAVLKEDLKQDPDQLFAKFDPEPLGAASLAQVYKADLRCGGTVAVKVQHRDVKRNSNVDMKTMEFLVNLANRMFPDFKLMWLADATKKNLPLELDFLHEARNAERVANDFKGSPWLRVPKVHWDYCTERVLVMEFVEGGFVTDLDYMREHQISPKEVVDKLGQLYSDMIFTHGNVHADPHPGNIIVRPNDKGKLEVCLLDHGLYAHLTNQFRYSYSLLWLAIINSDIDGIKKYSEELGVGDFYGLLACIVTARSWESISNKSSGGIAATKSSAEEKKHIKENIGRYLPQITEVFERIPRSMILVLKTNDLLRGVESALKVHKTMGSFIAMSKKCVRAVYAERLRHCTTVVCRFRNHVAQNWELFKIRSFEIYLWLNSVIFWSDTNGAM